MMTQLNGALNKHWTAVAQHGREGELEHRRHRRHRPYSDSIVGRRRRTRARVMYVKFRLKQEFPTTFAEALNPYPLPPKPTYVAYLNKLGITGSSAATGPL